MHRGVNRKLGVKLIYVLKAHKLLRRGWEGYLCNVVDSATVEPSVENIQRVLKFSYVFPEEIPSMPLLREVEFCID